jgi:hypothetical protein
MEEKRIVASVMHNSTDDVVTYIDSEGNEKARVGLCKEITSEYHCRTFRDLIVYLCSEQADSHNPMLSSSECALSKKILQLSTRPDYVLHPRMGREYNKNLNIKFDDIVQSYFPQILNRQDVEIDGCPQTVYFMDLQIDLAAIGGGQNLYATQKTSPNHNLENMLRK